MNLRAVSLSLVLLLIPLSTVANHVETSTATSDAEAFAIYLSEYQVQKAGLIELYQQTRATESASERSTAILAFQRGLVATIAHLEALQRPACLDIIHELVLEELDAVGRSVSSDNPPLAAALLGYAGSLSSAVQSQIAGTLLSCGPGAVA